VASSIVKFHGGRRLVTQQLGYWTRLIRTISDLSFHLRSNFMPIDFKTGKLDLCEETSLDGGGPDLLSGLRCVEHQHL
jgi:hypothetical protein